MAHTITMCFDLVRYYGIAAIAVGPELSTRLRYRTGSSMRKAVPMMPPAAAMRWRRHLAELKTSALSLLVRPPREPRLSLDNIAVSGLFRSPTGLGQSARLCRNALLDAGYTARLIDLCDQFKVSGGVPVESAKDLPRPGPGLLIVHINGPQMSRALWH